MSGVNTRTFDAVRGSRITRQGAIVEDLLVLDDDGKLYKWNADGSFSLFHTLAHVATNGQALGYPDGSIICLCAQGVTFDEYYHEGAWSHSHAADKCGCSCAAGGYHSGVTWAFRSTSWYRWNGAAWSTGANVPTVANASASSGNGNCWAASAADAWVSCASNRVHRTIDGGASWVDQAPQVLADTGLALSTPSGIWGLSANEVYIGDNGRSRVLKWNGANFSVYLAGLFGYEINIWGLASDKIIVTTADGSGKIKTYLNTVLVDTSLALSYTKRRMRGTSDGKRVIQVAGNFKGRVSENGGVTWSATPATWPSGAIDVAVVAVA